jgi:hypothetical protein
MGYKASKRHLMVSKFFVAAALFPPYSGRYHAAFSGLAPWSSMAVSRSHGFAVR